MRLLGKALKRFELDVTRDPEGNAIEGKMKLKLEYDKRTFLIAQRSSLGKPDVFKDIIPIVFRPKMLGVHIVCSAEYTMARRRELFLIRSLRDGSKEFHLWWDSADYNRGTTADAVGSIPLEQ